MQEVWAVTLMEEQGNRIPEFTWSQVSDSTSSQCLFRIKCFLSSLSRNRRIRSRSERLSRSLQAGGYICTFVSVLFVLLYSSSVVQRFLELHMATLTCICASPLLWSPSLVVSAFPALSAPWSGQMTGCLSSLYWKICAPDSLSSV